MQRNSLFNKSLLNKSTLVRIYLSSSPGGGAKAGLSGNINYYHY